VHVKRVLKIGVIAAAVAVAAFGLYQIHQVLMIGAGYYAKILCSGVFVSGRAPDEVIAEDVRADQTQALGLFSSAVDREAQAVDAWIPSSFAWQRAIHRDGYGCHLALETDRPEKALRPLEPMTPPDREALWPEGGRLAAEALPPQNREALSAALEYGFTETDPEQAKRTRAIAVVHRGRLVAERYAQGFNEQTPQLGWSMAKSVTNALAGALAARGRVAVDDRALVQEWGDAGDPRSAITLDHLLRMSSGLEFSEDYGAMLSDVRMMLFLRGDKAGFAADKPPACEPGECWYYSSGTSNIVARILQNKADKGPALAHELLFAPLGMRSAVFEPDASHTLVSSSYVYASARDWARFGLLYMRGGEWDGETIFTRDWLDYTLKPSPGSGGDFGAHVWLAPPEWNDAEAAAAVPEDDFYFLGHDGQMVAVVPSREAVIVRLGLTRFEGPFDHARLVRSILDALPE
jgi:CubicO group peptidase (beta-lactamase class C family)